ncbi:gelsolin, cytoplasmic-like isoform X1 [Tachypleus tridentatus]|uniref:gelsolin, cytoplasmic-like isoform X1 n=1 Tax=Tachypleus tridentatus TaxID=6853 RepID=UPI003FD34BCF
MTVPEEPAFEGVGQEPGLLIWRIENFEVKPLESQEYGTFYSGDSYILLHTKKTRTGKLEWNIHFWLGKDTSQDEKGTAAIKAVALDNALGGAPVQHREVQSHESQMFLSYFKKKGVRYLEGGVASGFRHVEDEVMKCMMQVKGRHNVRAFQVDLNVDSMNKGDCFILDAGPNIYIWVGPGSRHMERIKAIQVANGIRDDIHAGRGQISIIDEHSNPRDHEKFFEDLGSEFPVDIKDAEEVAEDTEHERAVERVITLHKIWEEDGEVNIEKIAERPLKQEHLDPGNCFMLDGGVSGLFVWVGKEASPKEREESMKMAEKYLETRGYPSWTSVTRIIDGGEPPMFKQYFSSWHEPEDQVGLGRVYKAEEIAATVDEEFDINSLHREKRRLLAKSLGKACGFMPDDGSGQIEIWRIENFELAPIDSSIYGFFFGGDSYVLKYTYEKEGREMYIIYFWQGLNSSQDEKAASAILTVKMDNELGGKAVQVRVVQGSEPQHFLRIFKGKMVVFMGGHASGFRNIHDHDTYDEDGTRMFQIKGTSDVDTRAQQVPEKATSLNSDDVFVVETPSVTHLWIGKESSEDELNMARNVAELVSPGREIVEIGEEEEPDEFWNSIGGKNEYQKSRGLPSTPLLEPRLFKCSEVHGRFRVEEMCNFTQEDLSVDDVMVLDAGEEVFVWIGNGASEEEKTNSLKLAEDYIRCDPTDRTLDNTVIITVKQGEEPESFKLIFDKWDPAFFENFKTYNDIRQEFHP